VAERGSEVLRMDEAKLIMISADVMAADDS
jgi:hypothetical protein